MSLTTNGTSISSSMPPPPCTLEIKFSTQESKDTNHRQLIIGDIQRNSRYDRYEIAWGIMINKSYGKCIEVKINDNNSYYGYYNGGKVLNDGEPHTIRLCIDTNSHATIYEDGKLIMGGTWNPKCPDIHDHDIYDIGTHLGGSYHLRDINIISAPTTFYYVKIAKKCITDSHINKSDCSDYWTWNSDGYAVLNGVPYGSRVSGVCDDITLDTIDHLAYNHELNLYGIKK